MSLKTKLRVFAHDKLSHYQWATWLVMPLAFLPLGALMGYPIHLLCLVAGLGSPALAWAIGKASEWLDGRVNEAAEIMGQAPPRQVSEGDVIATALGGVPQAIPLLIVAAMTWPR